MTWTRLDDSWTDSPILADLPIPARWHYLAMIQFCSRAGHFDGVMRKVDAVRCSDVDNPKAIVDALAAAGLVEQADDPRKVRHVQIADHVPPVSVREKADRDRDRKERSRRHAAGDHAACYRQRCEQGQLDEPAPKRHTLNPSPVTSHVTSPEQGTSHVASPVKSHVTPGRDGTGRAGHLEANGSERVDPATGEVLEHLPGDPWCSCPACKNDQTQPKGR